ncbi:hypothetical protein R50345_06095 [Paenibacillus sp. FSL R5-0345]|uniref:hypothetical protein n=1 Tax=Paenibacillus sp. FSL R5-0345 TaxID=1536770 RepID=UPI0004F695E2|nr:hypothetical protein [Paenibacillus sp. FSL R5-0345]AIQ34226.1 hypothetical protein R50345_06095 [Paenibacillus sp. FSL R5-0345]
MAETPFAIEITPSLGMNSALNPGQLPQGSHRLALDACLKSIDTIGKRPGSVPVTSSALGQPLTCLMSYKAAASSVAPDLFAVSGNTLYKYSASALTAQTMTNAFTSSNVFGVGYTDFAEVSNLLLTSGGSLQQYTGTEVKNVVPAADDTGYDPTHPSILPPNTLATINARGIKYIWVFTGHVFVSDGTDLIWYSKRYHYDYFPGGVQYFRFIADNDYVTGPGISFGGLCLIPMRRHWGVITGETFDDGVSTNSFKANQYLNTSNGNISSRGYCKITYPTGQQTIAYMSDNGVNEIFDTGVNDVETSGTRQYSTRNLMDNKIDFNKYRFTDAEKAAAVASFDSINGRLLVAIDRDTTHYMFVYETQNQEWYIWRLPWSTKSLTEFEGNVYMGNTTGLLHTFNEDLTSDWDNVGKSSGTTVKMYIATGLLSAEFTGESSYFHYLQVESAMWTVKSSLDIVLVYGAGALALDKAIFNEIGVYDVSAYDEAQYANLRYTDNVNQTKRKKIHKKAKYAQIIFSNDRDEPMTILRYRIEGTASGIGG